jgi:C-terminal processing protease CtpA/Prc
VEIEEGGKVMVSRVVASSPVGKVGLEVGHRILAIDGQEITGIGPSTFAELIAAAPGPEVELTVVAKQSPEPRKLRVTREAGGAGTGGAGAGAPGNP